MSTPKISEAHMDRITFWVLATSSCIALIMLLHPRAFLVCLGLYFASEIRGSIRASRNAPSGQARSVFSDLFWTFAEMLRIPLFMYGVVFSLCGFPWNS